MIALKTVVGGFAIAGTLALGTTPGIANAEPSHPAPQVTSSQDSGHPASPSPYAAYGDASICATPGLYFVNVCS